MFSPALIVVAGTRSYPCSRVNLARFLEGGRICFRHSLRWRGAFTRTAPGNEVGCISNKQTEDGDKFFMQLPTRIYLTAALNFVTTHC